MLKILSMAFAFLIVALVLLFGVGGEICFYQVALYQILCDSAVFITRLYKPKIKPIWSYIVDRVLKLYQHCFFCIFCVFFKIQRCEKQKSINQILFKEIHIIGKV